MTTISTSSTPTSATQPHWHSSITASMRHQLVAMLSVAFLSVEDPADESRRLVAISASKLIEMHVFGKAADERDYYHLPAETIFKVQRTTSARLAKEKDG